MNQNQPQSAVVAFDAKVSQSLIAKDLASGATTFKPMSRVQYKTSHPNLTGQALKRAHKAYCEACGTEAGGEIAKSITTQAIIPTGWTVNKAGDGGSIRFVTKARFDRLHTVNEVKAPALTEDKALAYIAKVKGITVAELQAALELTAAQ